MSNSSREPSELQDEKKLLLDSCNALWYKRSMIVIDRLLWDSWNVARIARHQVIPVEEEKVCQGESRVEEGYKGRIQLLRPTKAERVRVVILEPFELGLYHPITARDASRKERQIALDALAVCQPGDKCSPLLQNLFVKDCFIERGMERSTQAPLHP